MRDGVFDCVAWPGGLNPRWGGARFGSRIVDSRTATVDAPPELAFPPIQRIGGQTGWYYGNWLWRLRGILDLLAGGVGLRRGRRNALDLCVGDVVDFWPVEAFIRQTAIFDPIGLAGLVYWYIGMRSTRCIGSCFPVC